MRIYSYNKLQSLALAVHTKDRAWIAALADTKWIEHIQSILAASVQVASAMHRYVDYCSIRECLLWCKSGGCSGGLVS